MQEIATKGFRGCSVTKLYPQWGKMKVSAMTHEKNGQDIVDNEVWELLQLHNDVQKNLSKYASKKESKGDSGDKITQKDTENKGRLVTKA